MTVTTATTSATATTATPRRSGSTKAEIVAEAAGLFGPRGFAAVSVQEIADRVGITPGAIYRHFASKEAVLHAVMFDCIGAWLAAADLEPPSIKRIVDQSVQLVVDRPGQLATYVRERHRADGATKRELARREAVLSRRWGDAIRAARPGLSQPDVVVRQQAVNGALSSLALRPAGLDRPRLRALATAGLVALAKCRCETSHDDVSHRQNARERAYRPPVSRRQQIMTVAMRLFAERGYHGVSMDDIGDAVGMSGPSLYEYVSGKSGILLDAFDQAGAFVIAGAAAALRDATSPADALDRLARSFIEIAFDHVDLLVVTIREGASLPDVDRPRLTRRQRDLHEQWAAVLRQVRGGDVSPADARSLVRSAIALVSVVAWQRRGDSPSVGSTVALVRAFLTAAD